MLGNFCMSIKAVNSREYLSELGRLNRQVCCASAAEDKYVKFVLVSSNIVNVINGNALCEQLYARRVTSCKYSRKLNIGILMNSKLNASA